jgi:protein-L-isoaspartate(D-aspartate) O-methyltransferase
MARSVRRARALPLAHAAAITTPPSDRRGFQMTDAAVARANMVENQLRPSRIDDPGVLSAMGAVPRERFVPAALRDCAYGDEDLALGGGRYLIEPLALAKLLQAASPKPGDVTLLLGDITGYAAAVLSRLVGSVCSLLPPGLSASEVEAALRACENVVVEEAAPEVGAPKRAPFDLIILIGAVPEIPPALLKQLGPDGGRLVAVVEHGRGGQVVLAQRIRDAVGRVSPFDAAIHRLPGLNAEPAFSF